MFKTKHNYPRIVFLTVSILAFIALIPGLNLAEENAKVIELSVDDAILISLDNNSAFKIELMQPLISESQLEIQKSAFDTSLSGSITHSDSDSQSGTGSDSTRGEISLSKKLSSGAGISLDLSSGRGSSSTSGDDYTSRISLSLSQPLMKGAWTDINLAGINKAKLGVESSKFELKGYVETLLYQVESAYWDYLLAMKQVQIYEESLKLAEKQFDESKVLVDVGKVAAIELIAAEAEVASRREGLISAQSNLYKARFGLLRLLNIPDSSIWNTEIKITDDLDVPDFDLGEIAYHIEQALQNRPDLNQARLLLERNELDVVVTKNGLLPSMNFFISLGMSGYADSFGSSFSDIGASEELQFGLQYSQPIGNRSGKEQFRQSVIGRDSNKISFDNLKQMAIEDVSVAWIDVKTAKEQITATSASKALQEEKLRAETEKYRVGKSTNLQVAQAQRDLLSSQIAETRAMAAYRKAIVNLFRQEGLLLGHYNIELKDYLS